MALPNLEKLTTKELNDLQTRVAEELNARKEAEKAAIKQRIDDLASVHELYGMGRGRGAGKGGKVAPKYRNPDNKMETWTGRGRQPRWLVAKLSKGGKLTDFTI
jgi:DNA-binding protein H-NS